RDVVVDDQLVLRVVSRIEGEQILYLWSLSQRGHELVCYLPQPLVVGHTGLGLVEQAQRNAPGGAKSGNGWRLEELEFHVAHVRRASFQLLDDLLRGRFALTPATQIDDGRTCIGTATFRQDFVASNRCH